MSDTDLNCPYCGFIHDPTEIEWESDDEEIECVRCERPFMVSCSMTYRVSKMHEGKPRVDDEHENGCDCWLCRPGPQVRQTDGSGSPSRENGRDDS